MGEKKKTNQTFLLYANTASLLFLSVFVQVGFVFFAALCACRILVDQGSNLGSGRAES